MVVKKYVAYSFKKLGKLLFLFHTLRMATTDKGNCSLYPPSSVKYLVCQFYDAQTEASNV